MESAPQASSGEVLVFGQNGIMVRARTPNQKKMVESTEKNDVVFVSTALSTSQSETTLWDDSEIGRASCRERVYLAV